MKQFCKARARLAKYGIRDEGGYAELLVAKALCVERNTSGVQKGYDLLCKKRGRIEVRCRVLPRDGRNEDRLQIPKEKVNGFDVFAGVLFNADLSIVGGFMLTHDEAIALASAGNEKYLRIPFRVGIAHPKATNITARLKKAQGSL
jgi:hypothetical protein